MAHEREIRPAVVLSAVLSLTDDDKDVRGQTWLDLVEEHGGHAVDITREDWTAAVDVPQLVEPPLSFPLSRVPDPSTFDVRILEDTTETVLERDLDFHWDRRDNAVVLTEDAVQPTGLLWVDYLAID